MVFVIIVRPLLPYGVEVVGLKHLGTHAYGDDGGTFISSNPQQEAEY